MKIPKLILSRPKLVIDTKCPKCHSMDIQALANVELTCKNCKTKFTSDVQLNIVFTTAKKFLQLRANNNEFWVLGKRDDSEVFNTDDMLKPRSKMEDDIYHSMLAYKRICEMEGCYDVSEVTNDYDIDYKIRCNECGVCFNCVICTRCGERYTPEKINTPQGVQRRYKCPKCSSRDYTRTYINKIAKVCPGCGSNNIQKTSFSSDKKQCPRCHSENITSPKKVPVYKLIVQRQGRFKL